MRAHPFLALAAALVALSADSPEPAADSAAKAAPVPPYHRDATALEQAALAVSRAILREDAAGAGRELERMTTLAPALAHEARAVYGSELWNADGSLQLTLKNAREYAAAGDIAELFNEFVWVQRSCLHCHGLPGVSPRPAPSNSK